MEKLVPKLRFSEFDGNWEEKSVSELGTFIGGGTPDSSNEKYWKGNIPWISSSDLKDNNIHEISMTRYINEEAIENSATKLIPKNSVLMVSRVGIGKFAVNRVDLCTSQDFTNLKTNNNSIFVANYFNARSNRFIKLSQGTSIQGFTTKDLKSAKFNIPSHAEQQKIASFLTSVDERLTLLSQQKEKLELYKKGVMQQIFSQKLRFKDENGKDYPDWKRGRFSKFIKLYRGSSPRPIIRYITTNKDGVNWIKIGDTKNSNNYRISSVSEKITKEGALKSRAVKSGEIILANSMSFGKSYLLQIDGCIYDGWFVLREYEKHYEKEFLIQILNSEFLQKQYFILSTGGVVQNISSEIVYSTDLFCPCLEEQQKIASFLSTIDVQIEGVSKKIEQTKMFKKGLLQQMFV